MTPARLGYLTGYHGIRVVGFLFLWAVGAAMAFALSYVVSRLGGNPLFAVCSMVGLVAAFGLWDSTKPKKETSQ